MSRFHGPQPGSKSNRPFANQKKGPKGALRMMRQIKREEAEERNAKTDPANRRAARRNASAETAQH